MQFLLLYATFMMFITLTALPLCPDHTTIRMQFFRLEKYKEAMAELGLDCPEEYIFEGDFWKNCAADAANHFMNLTNRPQAIVCANDYMALSLCKELTLQGYSVHRISPFQVLIMYGMRVQMYHR